MNVVREIRAVIDPGNNEIELAIRIELDDREVHTIGRCPFAHPPAGTRFATTDRREQAEHVRDTGTIAIGRDDDDFTDVGHRFRERLDAARGDAVIVGHQNQRAFAHDRAANLGFQACH
jgi:hypothetical protein